MDNLSRFLEQQRAAGSVEQLDSSFTLSLEKGREKLSSYSLVNPEDYLLKVVQSAVVVEAQQLNIKLLRQSVIVYFELPTSEERLAIDRLSRALAAPLEEAERARSYLALALCAAANDSPSELMWGEWEEDSGTILSLGRERSEVFRKAPLPYTEPLKPGQKLQLFFLQKERFTLLLGQTAREHSAIAKRCSFAPISIVLDGKPLAPQVPVFSAPSDPLREFTEPYFAKLEIDENPGGKLRWSGAINTQRKAKPPNLPFGLHQASSRLPPVHLMSPHRNLDEPPEQALFFDSLYALPVYLYGPSTLIYIKDGVSLNPVKVHDSGGGAVAVLPGNQVTTDLTGLQVVVDETVEKAKAVASERWERMLDEHLTSNPPLLNPKSTISTEHVLLSFTGCLIFGWVGLLFGPLYAYFRRPKNKKDDRLERFLEQRNARADKISYSSRPAAHHSTSKAPDWL